MDTLKKKKYVPKKSGFWKGNYVTYRRLWVDSCLNAFIDEVHGLVIDLGGKRENKRGSFLPPEHQADAWLYLNLDPQASPNIFSDVVKTPLLKQSADYIICTEVLEHLSNPQACVDEIHRILREDGIALVSVPFFFPVHADPYDFQRFTEGGLWHMFRNFRSVEIHRMGGYTGVIGLGLELGISGVNGNSATAKFLRWSMKWISRWLCWYDLSIFGRETPDWERFTTGYFVRAVR